MPLVLTLLTVLVGLYQFNKGQKANAESRDYQFNMQILSKFKETQQKVYAETMGIVSYLAAADTADFKTQKYANSYNRLEQLYWVELSTVQSPEVDTALIFFKNDIDNLKANNFRKINEKKIQLMEHANGVAEAIRNSLMDWSLPGGMTGLGGTLNLKKK